MDHDVKSLQVLIEGEFRTDRALDQQRHTENKAAISDIRADVAEIRSQTTASNGRLGKVEVAVAVLKFAVYTIGGTLILAGLQILVGKLAL